ncbi:MAG: DNA primase [Patescibacteria group bacterium]
MEAKEEIKQKLDILTLVGEYVEMKRTGLNHKGRCPFHKEKTPSFFVSPERGTFHCFGCGAHGDIFTFVQKMEGLDFPEALKLLAKKTGVKIEEFNPEIASQKNRLQDICVSVAYFWQKKLKEKSGEQALAYLKKRQVKDETIENFKIGYASDSWDETNKFLQMQKFTEQEIFLAGLTVKKENGFGYYDRFRDRVMFPIADVHGNIVGFTGRALKNEDSAKYVNTPESQIFHKGKILFALDRAKAHIREKNYAIIVEGNMDAITCHEFNYNNVVACSGTALTSEQILLLKRYTNNVALCFDQDSAGQTAAERSIDLLLAEEINIKVIKIFEGKDPDECLKKNVSAWEKSLREAKEVMLFYFENHLTEENLRDIVKKKEAIKFILQKIFKIKDKIEQEHWLKKIAAVSGVSMDVLWQALAEQKENKFLIKQKEAVSLGEQVNDKRENHTQEDEILLRIFSIAVNFPKQATMIIERLNEQVIENRFLAEFYKNLNLLYNQSTDFGETKVIEQLGAKITENDRANFDELVMYFEKTYENFNTADLVRELLELIARYYQTYHRRKIDFYTAELNKVEILQDETRMKEILQKLKEHNDQLVSS